MTTFTIDNDNNITAFATPEEAQDALALGAHSFTSQKELAKITADWPASRLVETWNAFAGAPGFQGLKPVKKFENRAKAIGRIWGAIQRLAHSAGQGAQGAPEGDAATAEAGAAKGAKKATRAPGRPRPEPPNSIRRPHARAPRRRAW